MVGAYLGSRLTREDTKEIMILEFQIRLSHLEQLQSMARFIQSQPGPRRFGKGVLRQSQLVMQQDQSFVRVGPLKIGCFLMFLVVLLPSPAHLVSTG